MSLSNIAALCIAMLIMAAIPSVSVLAVAARAAASGFLHGVSTSLGIVVGDIVFILIAVLGLAVLAETMDSVFILIKYLGGAYLIWLGSKLLRAKPDAVEVEGKTESSLFSSFMTGLLITLADQKAILFYLGFFPAFVDLAALSYLDTGLIIVIAVIAVGGPKLVYAYIASRAGLLISARAYRAMNMFAGGVMIVVGVLVMIKA